MIYIILLLLMVFLHVLFDWVLQGDHMALMKQRDWWLKHPDYKKEYKHDYIIVLFMHAFFWSFGISIPCIVYSYLYPLEEQTSVLLTIISIIVINTVIHAFVDHLKANERSINLVTDQIAHLLQVGGTWILFANYYIR